VARRQGAGGGSLASRRQPMGRGALFSRYNSSLASGVAASCVAALSEEVRRG
jgi:hypothetical protein